MLLFHILAALWDGPGTASEIAAVLRTPSGGAVPEHPLEHQLQLLRGGGYLAADASVAAPTYTLTSAGSALLARLAQAVEHTERISA